MSMELLLIKEDRSAQVGTVSRAIVIPKQALDFRDELLMMCSKVKKVEDVDSQQYAVDTQSQVKRILKNLESVRVEIKAPYKSIVDDIDRTAKEFRKDLEEQEDRIQKELNAYQFAIDQERRRIESERQAKILAAEHARREAEEKAKRLSEEAMNAKGKKNREDLEKAALEASEKVALAQAKENQANTDLAPMPEVAARTYGKRKVEWDILDLSAFAVLYPNLVTITPKAAQINQLTACGSLKSSNVIRVWESAQAVVKI